MRDEIRACITFIILFVAVSSVAPILTPARAMLEYNSGNPTPDQQLVLEYINRARANPVAEGQRLGFDIHEGLEDDPANGCYGPEYVLPRPPLAMNPMLLGVAQGHVEDMYNQNYFSHTDPNGTTAFQRMTNAGYNFVSAGEDMAAGTGMSATDLQDYMMEDFGTPCRPHRMNLLDIFPDQPATYQEVGVGYYQGANGQAYITEDFGTATGGPFLVGVVYNNAGGNNFYQEGEGIGGVTITPSSGTYYAVTSSSGGYAIPIGTSGTITVTASGPGFGPITQTVTLTGANVKLDFTSTQPNSASTTSTQTSLTSTSAETQTATTTSTMTSTLSTTTQSSTQSSTTYSQTATATSTYTPPTITLNKTSTRPESVVHASGSGFSSSDTSCTLNGTAVDSQSCSMSNGDLIAAFTVANVTSGSYTITAIGNPIGDAASAVLSVTGGATQSTTTSTTSDMTSTSSQALTSDFIILPSSPTLAIAQGSNGSDQVTVSSINGFNAPVTILTSWLGATPLGVAVSIPSQVAPNSGGQVTSQMIVVANTTASPGSFTIRITGTSSSVGHSVSTDIDVSIIPEQTSVMQTETTTVMATSSSSISSTTFSLPAQSSSCVVASSTAGSSLAPLVEKLRDFRDRMIMKTEAGRAFMMLFNSWYYSFSPQTSTYLETHPSERSLVKSTLYPLLLALETSYYVYILTSYFGPEAATVTAGVFAAVLLGLIYLAPIVIVAKRLFRRHLGRGAVGSRRMILWVTGSILALVSAYPLGSQAVGIATANLVLSAVTATAIFGPAILATAYEGVTSVALRTLLTLGEHNQFSCRLAAPSFKAEH